MIRLKHILKEDEVEDNFGKVAFGSDMDIVRMQGGDKGEKNTPYETELLGILERWTEGGWEGTSDLLWKKYSLLKKASKVFPRVLKPNTPNGTEVFRGLQDINPKLEKKLSKTNPSDWVEDRGLWKYSNPITYTPRSNVQSWSSNPLSALEFANSGVLLSTKQNDEFLFNQEFMRMVFSRVGGGSNEAEILHFGKKYSSEIYIEIQNEEFEELFQK